MKVKELIERLESFDPNTEVMTKKTEVFGNIGEVNSIRNDSYGFFGKAVPCVLLTDEFEDSEEIGKQFSASAWGCVALTRDGRRTDNE